MKLTRTLVAVSLAAMTASAADAQDFALRFQSSDLSGVNPGAKRGHAPEQNWATFGM